MAKRRNVSTAPRRERACVVGAEVRGRKGAWRLADSLDELAALAEAADAVVVGRVMQTLQRPARTYVGAGKLDELRRLIDVDEIDTVIFDDELAPAQQRRLEDTLKVKVIDRSGLILDVFARRARTAEGKLQTELAQAEYLLPRLAGQWSHLERLGGGIGTRGPGETQIETDRRLIRRRLSRIKKELERVRQRRFSQRRNRLRTQAGVAALVGYTNAGKSALFNRLTASSVVERNQLFSTLDTTTRRVHLPSGSTAILSDTVGFIYKLPPIVVAAFRATLEELYEADVLVHVVDISSPHVETQIEVVNGILDEMGLADVPRVLVLNKMDLVTDDPGAERPELELHVPSDVERVVLASAETGWGLDSLRVAIECEIRAASVRSGRDAAAAVG
ncbi:MAG: GTPase HflX [Dehalococcoidia bacterium]